MSRSKANNRTENAMDGGWRRARKAAALLRRAAGRAMPLTKTAAAAAGQQADRTRAWAAPRVERAGHVVQDSLAPRVSAMLSAAARRLEPEKPKPRRRRWRRVIGVSAAAAAASAVAAAVRGRVKGSPAARDLAEAGGDHSGAGTASTTDTVNEQRSPLADVNQDSAARTS